MNINIGENIGFSWLKHIKNCIICQTNWKLYEHPDKQAEQSIDNLLATIGKVKGKKHKLWKSEEALKILKQTEIDVVGVDSKYKYYLLEAACHIGSLNCGGKEITQDRVIKKFVKMAIVAEYIFKCNEAEIIFASPIVSEEIGNNVCDKLNEIKNYFKKCQFTFIRNKDFTDSITDPLIAKVAPSISETEPFMRALLFLSRSSKFRLNK